MTDSDELLAGAPTLRNKVVAERKENNQIKRNGRPSKKLLNKNKGIIGRPKGDKAIMDDYRKRLIASPKSKLVLDKILTAALDDNHKHQGAAWKLLVERLMPLSSFDSKSGNAQPSISINISGVGEVEIGTMKPVEDDYNTIDGEYETDE